MARDRKETERKLIEAAGEVLARDGFFKLGVNAIARQAGVDKVLIYRYFDGLSGLIKAYAQQGDFWPSTQELLDMPVDAIKQKHPSEQIAIIMENYAAGIRRRPVTLQILGWEMVERNELTAHLETVREEQGRRLFEMLWYRSDASSRQHSGRKPDVDIEAFVTILSAAVNYLAARSRLIRIYNGIELKEDRGWQRIVNLMRLLCERVL